MYRYWTITLILLWMLIYIMQVVCPPLVFVLAALLKLTLVIGVLVTLFNLTKLQMRCDKSN
jgi:uncharacterized membrane-anchored protein